MKVDINCKNHYFADEGKIFKRKNSEDILSNELYLASWDKIENYEEVEDCLPEDEKNDIIN